MVTIKDIAKRCNVSPSTVSKVIKNYPTIPEETKERVLKAIQEMNYVPNAAASALSSGDYRNIGILGFLNDKQSPFSHPLFAQILASFQKQMSKKGYDLCFIDKNVRGKPGSFLQNCEYRNVSGVLLFGNLYDAQMMEVINSNIPSIGFDYKGEEIDSVYTNGKKALIKLTEYLIENGHKNIVFVAGDYNSITKFRMDGFRTAMKKNGLTIKSNSIYNISYGDAEGAKQITEVVLKEHPDVTAILYPDDICALAGMSKLKDLNIQVPEQISVAGFDGHQFSQLLYKPLCTMKQDTYQIGIALANTLIDIIKNPTNERRIVEFDAELIKGQTVAKVN